MILVTKTSDQTRQRGHTLSTCTNLYVCMYVCIHVWPEQFQQSMDQPGKVANPARGQPNRKSVLFPVPVRA